MGRSRFHGEIFGIGTESGVRVVIGHWTNSPLGHFTDVMVQFRSGHRLLLAPTSVVSDFVTATYSFDEIQLTPVSFSRAGSRVAVSAGDLQVSISVGRPTLLGRLLAALPAQMSTAPWFCRISDPIARLVLQGVRTRGSAGNGRREYYGARHQHRVTAIEAAWQGENLGRLTPVDPPVTFGFGSTPASPSVTAITTTVDSKTS